MKQSLSIMRCGISLTKILVAVGIVTSLLSCNRGQTDNESIFEKEIGYIPIETDQQFLFDNIFNPRKMRAIDNLLLVSDFQNFPPIHVLKTEDDGALVYLKGEGREGRGPGEFQLVEDFIETDSLIYVYDGGQLKLISYYKDMIPAPYNDIHDCQFEGLKRSMGNNFQRMTVVKRPICGSTQIKTLFTHSIPVICMQILMDYLQTKFISLTGN